VFSGASNYKIALLGALAVLRALLSQWVYSLWIASSSRPIALIEGLARPNIAAIEL
jgi:hypothetical protein